MDSFNPNDPVWKLLGKARRTEAGPFFSRNVLRELRKLQAEGRDRESVWTRVGAWLFRPAPAPALLTVASAAAIAWMATVAFRDAGSPGATTVSAPDSPQTPIVTEFDPAREIGEVEYLGQLMAVADPSSLDDAAFADLLFR
ncbi:MAG: hypothetical protein H7A53_11845 [Akkermansiaceae bacterium]|nr:hypothetical protein [Akkermansiaceae bacterium]MCP5551572.1 hypothetical protein [Akkermansiaceae bacterium]